MKSKVSCGEWGVFLVRLVLGAIFIAQGWGKLQNMPMIISFFSSIGLAAFWAYLVAWVELVAGIAMLVGMFTRIAGYLISIVIIVAIYLVKFKMGFLTGYSSDLLIVATALAIAWNGPGPVSLANKICGCGKCMMCGGEMMKKKMGAGVCDNCDTCKSGCNGHEVNK